MVHDLRNLQTNYTPVLVTNITFLVLYAKNEVAAKIVRVYMQMLWIVLGRTPMYKNEWMLIGKLKLNPWGRPMWVCLKLKLTLKGDFCEISVTAFFANFFMYSPKWYLNEHIWSLSVPNTVSETKVCKQRAPTLLLCGVPPGKQITICSTWFFVRSMITVSWEYWLCFTQYSLQWMTGFMVRSNGVLLTFVYFYQLGETAWTSTLYFLTFTEVAGFEIKGTQSADAHAHFIPFLGQFGWFAYHKTDIAWNRYWEAYPEYLNKPCGVELAEIVIIDPNP